MSSNGLAIFLTLVSYTQIDNTYIIVDNKSRKKNPQSSMKIIKILFDVWSLDLKNIYIIRRITIITTLTIL